MPGLLHAELPIAAAPMAGGPTTPALVQAVTQAGAFAFLAAGYKTPQTMADEIVSLGGTESFGINLFVPQYDSSGELAQMEHAVYRRYVEELRDEADGLGVDLPPEPIADDDHWHAKVDVLTQHPVPVVSLTFGLPAAAIIAALRHAGTVVLATVTTPGEGREAEAAGVDGLIVQGPRAGGHSATFDPARVPGTEPTLDVLRAVRAATSLPLMATGGIDGPQAVTDLLAAGAESVAVGTMLLTAEEAGTSATHRAALADPDFNETVITRAFTGRPARALRNDFVDTHGLAAPLGYPALHHLTRELRRAAALAGDPQRLHLWAGTQFKNAKPGPAASIINSLVSEV